MSRIHIRACEPDDLSALVELCIKHAVYEGASYIKEGKVEKLKQILFCPHPSLHCLVVVVDSSVVGYASYTFDYSTWEAGPFLHMDCLYLEPAWRNQGIGHTLVQRIQETAKMAGCQQLQWQTPDVNSGAIQFYARLGAKYKNKVRFYLEVGE